jgi:serine/threonine-protein kinase
VNLATLEKDLSPRDRLAPGSRCELLARIASGGMGTVYLGRLRGPAGFRRLVALKRAHDHLVRSPSFARMFRTEARLASRLHHPNVVAVHDVEELDGELVLVMDYVQGGALSSLLSTARTHPLDPAIAIRILLDAAAGLDAAHELTDDQGRKLGLVHRDVSPENVLVGTDGIARISDFGVAKVVRGATSATDGRDLKGKIAYMAPEQARSDAVDRRADVFAVGVMLWEAATGTRPWRGIPELTILQTLFAGRFPRPRSIKPEIPEALEAILIRARMKSALDNDTAIDQDDLKAIEAEAKKNHYQVKDIIRAVALSDLLRKR